MRQRYIVLALIVLIAMALMLPSSAISRDKDTSEPWDWKESGALGNGSAMSLACDATRNIVYRGTHRGVYKYQGGEFTSLGGDIEGYNVWALAYDGSHNVLYAGTGQIVGGTYPFGIWRCDNPDTNPTWSDTGEEMHNNDISSLAYDAIHNRLYAGSGNGVWRCDTPNTSPNWTNTGGGLKDYAAVSLTYDKDNNKLYAGTDYQGVWRCDSPDTAPVWVRISTAGNVGGYYIMCLTYDSNNDKLYTGTWEENIWRCDNPGGGPVWHKMAPGDNNYYSLAYDSSRNKLYGGVGEGVVRINNPNTSPTFTDMGGDLVGLFTHSLAYDQNSNILYAGTGASLCYCTNPNTAPSWINTGPGVSDSIVWAMAYDGVNNIIYASILEGGVWRCDDPDADAPTWTNMGGGGVLDTACLTYDSTHNKLYAGTGGEGLWRCDNPNTSPTWVNTDSSALGGGSISALAYDSERNLLYAGTGEENGVLRCDNPDTNPEWTDTGGALSILTIPSLAYDLENNILYAGANYESGPTLEGHGVWRCDNPDTNPEWTKASTSDNAGDADVLSLFYDGTNNLLYAGTDFMGVWRCDNSNTSPFWTRISTSSEVVDTHHTFNLTYDLTNDLLYAATGGGVYVCTNPGTDPVWEKAESDEMPYGATCLLVIPPEEEEGTGGAGTGSIIYAGTGGQGVWYADSQASSRKTWYLAEGSTGTNEQGTFETWVLVQNSGAETATVTLTYMTPSGEVTGPTEQIGAGSRTTFNVADTPEVANEFNVSTRVTSDRAVIAERAMYWNAAGGTYRQCAHDSIGVTGAATTWYLAEGSTGTNEQGSFETWVLVANPGTQAANVNLTYMTPAGEVAGPSMEIAAGSRQSFKVADTPEVANEFNVSTRVTSDQPVIAERSMYWNPAGGPFRQAAHDSIGVTGTASTWYLAEGSTGTNEQGSFETWVLVANPGTQAANVTLTYMTPAGEIAGPSMEIAAGSRQSFNVADTPEVANEFNVSTRVTSNKPVIAERSMYWNPAGGPFRQAAHDSIGVTGSANTWDLAEGSTGTNEQGTFETWILVQNPGTQAANVSLTYMTSTGQVAGPTMEIAAGSRQSFNVADTPEVSNVFSVSTRVTSDKPVIAERAMYWNPIGGPFRQAAHDSIGVGL